MPYAQKTSSGRSSTANPAIGVQGRPANSATTSSFPIAAKCRAEASRCTLLHSTVLGSTVPLDQRTRTRLDSHQNLAPTQLLQRTGRGKVSITTAGLVSDLCELCCTILRVGLLVTPALVTHPIGPSLRRSVLIVSRDLKRLTALNLCPVSQVCTTCGMPSGADGIGYAALQHFLRSPARCHGVPEAKDIGSQKLCIDARGRAALSGLVPHIAR